MKNWGKTGGWCCKKGVCVHERMEVCHALPLMGSSWREQVISYTDGQKDTWYLSYDIWFISYKQMLYQMTYPYWVVLDNFFYIWNIHLFNLVCFMAHGGCVTDTRENFQHWLARALRDFSFRHQVYDTDISQWHDSLGNTDQRVKAQNITWSTVHIVRRVVDCLVAVFWKQRLKKMNG